MQLPWRYARVEGYQKSVSPRPTFKLILSSPEPFRKQCPTMGKYSIFPWLELWVHFSALWHDADRVVCGTAAATRPAQTALGGPGNWAAAGWPRSLSILRRPLSSTFRPPLRQSWSASVKGPSGSSPLPSRRSFKPWHYFGALVFVRFWGPAGLAVGVVLGAVLHFAAQYLPVCGLGFQV